MRSLSSTFATNIFSDSNVFQNSSSSNEYNFKKKHNFEKENERFTSLIGIGNPIIDISAEISAETIKKFNLKWGDSFCYNDQDDDCTGFFSELEKEEKVTHIPGGSIQNSLRVASWCLNMEKTNKIEFKVSMIGAVGNDNNKIKILKSLNEVGVKPILEIINSHETSRCGVGIYQKEKYHLADLRASQRLSEKFIENNSDIIFSHDSLLIEGYMLNNRFNICKKICETFKQNKKPVFFTLSSTNLIKHNYEKIIEIANDSDIIVGNIDEAQELAKSGGIEINKIFEIIFKKLKPNNERFLIITDLPNEICCGKYDYKNQRLSCIWTIFNQNLNAEEIQDLNGIGGAFLGGFLSQYMMGYDVSDCCRIGLDAANEIMKHVGCIFPKNLNLFEYMNRENSF
jgi:adenosine kinase